MARLKIGNLGKIITGASLGYGVLFVLVGLLAARKFASPTTTWTAVSTLATVTAAVVGIWTLISVRQDSRDRTRPVVVADLQPNVLSDVGELIVRNVGPSVARNIRFQFTPPLPVLEGAEAAGKLTPYLQRRYGRTIPTLGPGMGFHDVYQTTEPREPVPDDFTLTIDYDDTHGRHYSDSYELTVLSLRDHTRATPGGDSDDSQQRRRTRAVEAIARGVGRR